MFRIPACILTVCCIAWFAPCRAASGADEVVTIYSTYGYQDSTGWVIPVRLWVHERRSVADAAARKLVAGIDDVSSEEIRNFQSRAADFLADSESREDVSLVFERDPLKEQFHLADSNGRTHKSDLNGLIEGTLTLSRERADSLLKAQESRNGWLSLTFVSKGHSGTGRVRLIAPKGISVISDIDDTIKVTEIPAGAEIVMRNTFLRDYKAAPEMVEKYREWSDASFHYVSGGPWQMYGPLSEFLIDSNAGFPEGSFHMKSVRTNLFSKSSWKDLTDLITNSEQTFDHKVGQISMIMERFPRRRFILVGDSGEKDPEVYRAILTKFPEQVQEIWIRDIVNDRERNADRLAGMHIIPAATIHRGVSELEK
ncbi:MAG: App1 family protein [Planctomycetaceae bacterium]